MDYYPSQQHMQFESEPDAYHGDFNDELAKPSPNPRDSSSGLVISVVGGGAWVLRRKGFCAFSFFLHVFPATISPKYSSFVGNLTIWFFFCLGNSSLEAFRGRLLKVISF